MAYSNNSRNARYTSEEQAILTTILYSDIFNFPLTKEELWRLLISKKRISKAMFEKTLKALTGNVLFYQDGYYSLLGREKIITRRRENRMEVEKKLALAKKIAAKLFVIPTILFIGISGGLAAGDAEVSDDIDLFIIVKKNTLFTSRFWIVIFLEFMGVRRFPKQQSSANTICINLLIDETSLQWPIKKRDVYIAREMAQVQPLCDRDGMYYTLLRKNQWIQAFLPNIVEASSEKSFITKASSNSTIFLEKLGSLTGIEGFMRLIQQAYMRRHQTTEVVKKNHLAFHPIDYRAETLAQLNLKMRQFGLLTNI